MDNKKIRVIGAGLSGAVIARKLSDFGFNVVVFDERSHIAGNCYSERDEDTGVMVHKYGPHIFHTDNEEVWAFVNKFSKFEPYINRVKTIVNGEVYSLPINLHTINQFFHKHFSPIEAEEFISSISVKIDSPSNFEEQALAFVGTDIYEAFFKGYTLKQWGVSPTELPASILKRLPLRFNYNDNYFSHKYQGMPTEGYTNLVDSILNHKNIKVINNEKINSSDDSDDYIHTFYTGQLDGWFNFKFGRLSYRTLDFIQESYDGDFQGGAVINYPSEEIPYTRITEHKHFAPWESHKKSIIFKEYSRYCKPEDIPYYPVRLAKDNVLLDKYIHEAKKLTDITFLGRLATYRYLDMDVTIAEAINVSNSFITLYQNSNTVPVFFGDV
jgi:UDP-galactopyranose mutase